MSTTASGYIIDVTDDEGVAIIPAPPSPQELDSINPNQLSSGHGGVNSSMVASIGSSCPSRDSVSAAIALVRAKQVAKSAILRAEEQILQPRSVSSDLTLISAATDSSTKEKVMSVNEMVESENAVPIISRNKDKPITMSKATTGSLVSDNPRREKKQEDRNSLMSSLKDVTSSYLEVQVRLPNDSLPQGPSFEQSSDQPSPTIHRSSDATPGPPSLATYDSIDSDLYETVDANTIEDVNDFLNRLGVGALHSTSNGSVNSIGRLRMLSSNSSGASSDEIECNGSSIREVQPETLAEISAIIDVFAKKHGGHEDQKEKEAEVLPKNQKTMLDKNSLESETKVYAQGQVRTSQPSPNCKDPPSTSTLEIQSLKADPPGPSHSSNATTASYHENGETSFVAHSFHGESLEDSPPPPLSAAVEDEKKISEISDEDVYEELENPFVDKSFAANVRKVLSTVEEVTSMEAEDDGSTYEDNYEDNNDTMNYSNALSSSEQDADNVSQTYKLLVVASEEQESVYGVDGRKEPKGIYEKAKVEVEKIPVSNIGVEQAINNNMSLMSTDSQQIGIDRHKNIGQDEIHNKSKTSETLEIHDSVSIGSHRFSDSGSLPWALRDVASEETMRATGRRRPRFVVSGPRPSNKSRNVASLFDDTSQQASETASEFRNGLSFGSDDKSSDDGPSKSNEGNEDTGFQTSDSLEAERCMVDTLLYNNYEPDTDYNIQRAIRDEHDEPIITMNNIGKNSTDLCDLVVAKSGEVEIMTQDQSEDLDDQKLKNEPSGEILQLEVDQGALSSTKIDKIIAAIDDHQHAIAVDQNQDLHHLKELLVPLINDHKPSLIESAQIREVAERANVPSVIIDQFLDYVDDARPDETLLSKNWESFNADDDANEAFFVRAEAVREAAAKKSILDAAADVEDVLNTEEKAAKAIAAALTGKEQDRGENSILSSCVGENQPYSFLRQFEDLHLKDDSKADGGEQLDHAPVLESQDLSIENSVDVMSPTMLANYFLNVDQRKFDEEKEEKLANDFKRLITPVINGNKPTVIEEAQIRQAALKANVPLDFVDAFVDYIKDENPEITQQVLKEDESDFLRKGWEEIEDLDEDDAIAAFLSSKFGGQVIEKGEMCEKGDDGSSEVRALHEEKARELITVGSHDYESSTTSTIEQDFNRSEDSDADFHRSKEEIDRAMIGCETSASDGHKDSKKVGNEASEDSLHIPKVVESSNRDKTDFMDKEMLKACKSIESYDEGIWQRRTAMATYGWGWEEATWLSPKASARPANLSGAGMHGVAAPKDVSNFMFNKKSFPLARKNCKLSYDRRVKSHTGFFDVDMYSLQESAAFGEKNLYKDETPWELRHVRQRFLHERSLTFSRNWFGDLVKTSGNDKIKAPICKPKSMEMPMRKIPDPGDWTPEWYTTWGGRKLLLRRPSSESSIDSGSGSYTEKDDYDKDSLRSYSSGSSYEDDEDWEDAPECGTFVNTKQKIGEHVSRVHPDYTSSLRKSRWRKKYFPIGTFPY